MTERYGIKRLLFSFLAIEVYFN